MPLSVLFWRDLLVVGSCVNLAAGFAVLMLIAKGVSLSLALLVHFSLLPYNLFLAMAVWRSPERTVITKAVAVLWLVIFTLL